MAKKPITVPRPVLTSINKLLEYLEDDEVKSFMIWQDENPNENPRYHIYWHITKVSKWFEKVTKGD